MFKSVQILPRRGLGQSILYWTQDGALDGYNVYVAFSITGADGSWKVLNPDTPVPVAVGTYVDDSFESHSEHAVGFYRLLATNGTTNVFSKKYGIYDVLQPAEFGIVNGIIEREFIECRAANGIPMWHCIPRDWGTLASNTDPDTNETTGIECDPTSFGEKYEGGFYPPVLTWVRWLSVGSMTIKDTESGSGLTADTLRRARLLAWPKPVTGHMLVDPVTDRRYLVGQRINTHALRDIMPVFYEVDLDFLSQTDPRYKFDMPDADLAAFRSQPTWVPENLPYE